MEKEAQVHRGPAPHAAAGHRQRRPPSSFSQSPEGEPAVQSAGQDRCCRGGELSGTARGRGRRTWLAPSCVPSVGGNCSSLPGWDLSHSTSRSETEHFYKTLTPHRVSHKTPTLICIEPEPRGSKQVGNMLTLNRDPKGLPLTGVSGPGPG